MLQPFSEPLRTVMRKYQVLISHQTFELKKLGAGGLERTEPVCSIASTSPSASHSSTGTSVTPLVGGMRACAAPYRSQTCTTLRERAARQPPRSERRAPRRRAQR